MLNLFRKLFGIHPKCTCGSGGHPRRCRLHPWTYQQHISELNHDNLYDEVQELIEKVEKLETIKAELESLKKIVDQIDKVQNEILDK